MKEDQYVYKDCHIQMSTSQMANLMYAAIICKAQITTTFGIGIYNFTRVQNCRNRVDVKIFIHPGMVDKFESLAHVALKKPIEIQLN